MKTLSTQQKHETLKLLYSKREAAAALSLSVRAIEYLTARKELISRRVGGRTLIPLSSLEAFARRDHPGKINPGKQNTIGVRQ